MASEEGVAQATAFSLNDSAIVAISGFSHNPIYHTK
jgi:hypothetical protein